MATGEEQARAGWVMKQLEAELRRIGGPTLLDRARADARRYTDDRSHPGLPGPAAQPESRHGV